ncbi:hypothetical protein Ancab_000229 [Ancistrocladus abbreviatus]
MEDQEEEKNGGSSSNSSEALENNIDRVNKISTQLKILNEAEQDVERKEEDEEKEKKKKKKLAAEATGKQIICYICGKGFNSGQALGGHMRIHSRVHNNVGQSSKTNKTHLSKMKNKFSDLSGTSSNGKEIFNNDARNSSPQTVLDALGRRYPVGFEMEAADCLGTNLFRSLPLGWLMTGRRGRKNEDVIMSSGLNDPLLLEGAHNLMLLTQGGSQNFKTKLKIEDYRAAEGRGNRERGNGGVGNVILQRNSAPEELKFTNNDTEDSSEIRRKAKGKVVLKDESLLNLAKLDSDDEYWLRDECSDEDGNSEQHQGVQ